MLSIFPELLSYSLLGVFLIRVTLGLIFTKYGFVTIFSKKGKGWKAIGFIELACGILLLGGILTQAAALLVSLMTIGAIAVKIKTKNEVFKSPYGFYFLLFAVSLSLLFMGPGFFSFDLPL